MLSRSQRIAHKQWRKNHPEKQRLYSDHSAAKRYIRRSVNVSHLKELIKLIEARLKEL